MPHLDGSVLQSVWSIHGYDCICLGISLVLRLLNFFLLRCVIFVVGVRAGASVTIGEKCWTHSSLRSD